MIAGRFGSRRLEGAPKDVRPTTDRVREALFARLGDLSGQRILDLYAGTGAVGIEALSRGAESAVFVDRAQASLRALRRNLAALDLEDDSRVLRSAADRAVQRLGREGARFDLIFLDPPYDSDEIERVVPLLATAALVAPEGRLVVECGTRHALGPLPGFDVVDERRYGDTLITTAVARSPGIATEDPT